MCLCPSDTQVYQNVISVANTRDSIRYHPHFEVMIGVNLLSFKRLPLIQCTVLKDRNLNSGLTSKSIMGWLMNAVFVKTLSP